MENKKIIIIILLFCLGVKFPLFSFKYSDNIEEHFRFGYELWKANRLDEAEIEFRNLILINPQLGLGYLWLGKVLQKKGLLGEAIKVWQEGFRVEPENKEIKKLLTDYAQNSSLNLFSSQKRKSKEKVPLGYTLVEYKIKRGDTLKKIAKFYLGDENLASKIAEYNKIDYLGNLKDGTKIKILVPDTRLAQINSHSEKLEEKFIKKEKEGKPVGEKVVTMASASSTTAVSKQAETIPAMDTETQVGESLDGVNGGEDSETENISTTSEEVVVNQDNQTNQNSSLPTSSAESQEEEGLSDEVDNSIEICNDNKSKIEDAILNYNLEHLDEMNKDNFSLETLKKEGYLKEIPRCPEGGKYYLDENGKVRCSIHD